MGRIEKTFLDLAELKQKALIGYIVSGDPNTSSTPKGNAFNGRRGSACY